MGHYRYQGIQLHMVLLAHFSILYDFGEVI